MSSKNLIMKYMKKTPETKYADEQPCFTGKLKQRTDNNDTKMQEDFFHNQTHNTQIHALCAHRQKGRKTVSVKNKTATIAALEGSREAAGRQHFCL